jgi:hypothetical protein
MLKYVIAIPLIMHGLANLGGVFAPWTKGMQGFKDVPWLFSQTITFKSGVGKAFSLAWLASTICLVAAGVGVLLGQPWWIPLAIAGCICSLAAILPWWKAVVPGAHFGAVFDVLVSILLLSPMKA